MTTTLVPVNEKQLMPAVARAIESRSIIAQAMQHSVMVENLDYGAIPGTNKPTLLKPGAEKLCTFFGLCVEKPEIVEKEEDWTGERHNGEPFFYYLFCQKLTRNGQAVAAQMGSCNSWEKKYRYRNTERKCPKCGVAAIIKGKSEYGGGWLCFKKKGGCNAKFPDGDKSIESQEAGKTCNPDIADQVNTVLKMAQKRALVAATLVATNASEFFTQDVEDLEIIDAEYTESKQQTAAKTEQPKTAPANSNGNGQHQQKSFEQWVVEVASAWAKAGYCTTYVVEERLRSWAAGKGEQREMKDWPPVLQAAAREYIRKELLAEFKQPASEGMHQEIGRLCGLLGWDTDAEIEYLENAYGLVGGEMPQYEHKAQAIIFDLQARLREQGPPVTGNEAEGSEIPF